MTPQEIAEVRPRLADFAFEMLGGLPRKDQRAAGELYVRGLLTDGQRKSMQPMAARLGTDHQRLQQFITSSTWDYAAVRRNIARWFAAEQPADALVVDDTGFPKDGNASPCVARQYSGTLGKTGNCQVGVSVHLVTQRMDIPAAGRYRIDPARSLVAFRTRHIFGLAAVSGTMRVTVGDITLDPAVPQTSVTAAVSVSSFSPGNKKRDDDARKKKFLNVAAHPEFTFRAGRLAEAQNRWTVTGELTVRGVTSR
jgi:DDE superfamily endonuclease/YceI-like domain